MKARLIERRAWAEIIAPYQPEFVEAFKDAVPPYARRWNSQEKLWTVERLYIDAAVRILRRYYDVERLAPVGSSQTEHQPPVDCLRVIAVRNPHHTVLSVLPDAPEAVIRGAYRALASELHPDRNGSSPERMVQVNLAYEHLKKAGAA